MPRNWKTSSWIPICQHLSCDAWSKCDRAKLLWVSTLRVWCYL